MTATERRIAAICAEILGLASVALDDDLYELGSDSHQAVLVAIEIERVFGVDLPLETMESTASVRALSAWVDVRLDAHRPAAEDTVASRPGIDG